MSNPFFVSALIKLVFASTVFSFASFAETTGEKVTPSDQQLSNEESLADNEKTLEQTQIETITVTANKRKQSVQEIPLAINVLGAQDIIDLNVIDMDSVLTQFPNLSSNATTELNVGYTIRGVGTNNAHGNVSQAVGIYRDEISYGNPFTGILGVYDTERIEVLRGPQNSLFGRNTIAGAVHYISARPSIGDDHITGYMLADVGRFNQFDLTGVMNMPLTETLALRVSGQSVQQDGIYTNVATNSNGEALGERSLGDKNRQSARIQIAWQPSSETELLFNYHQAKHDGTNIGNRAFGTRAVNDPYLLINGAQDFRDDSEPDDKATISNNVFDVDANSTNIVNAVDRNGFNPATGDWHKVYNVSSARSYADISGAFIKLAHQFNNDYSINWTSSFDQTHIESADETSGTNSLQFIPQRDGVYEQQSHEVRILSPDYKAVRWLAGLYYFKEDMDLLTLVRRFNYIGPQGNVPRDISAYNRLDQVDEDMSVFGNLEWDLTDKLTLSSGLRYTDNKKTADSDFGVAANYNTNPAGGGSISSMPFNTSTDLIFDNVPTDMFLGKPFIDSCNAPDSTECTVLPPTVKSYELEQDLSEWGGRIALDYKYTSDTLFYTSYAHGFKSGGFDTRALAALFGEGAEQAFLPEFIDTVELGVKTQLSKSLQINSALFYNIWDDLQTFGIFDGQPQYVNIPESTTQGLETEIKWIPAETWFTQIGIGLLDTEVTDSGSLSAADEGHELPNSPWLTLNALLRKQYAIGSGLLTLQTDARYVSEQIDSATYDRDVFSTKDAQVWLNARANYQFGDEQRYNVALWINNMTEETHCVDIGLQNVITPTTTSADMGATGIDLTSVITCQPSATSGERFFGMSFGINFY